MSHSGINKIQSCEAISDNIRDRSAIGIISCVPRDDDNC